MFYYPFDDRDDDYEDMKWRSSEEYQRLVCSECRGVAIGHRGKPLDIVVRRDPKTFNPGHPGAAILPVPYANFLRAFDGNQGIIWGKILVGKSRVVSEKNVTAYMPRSLTMHPRGDLRSIYKYCSTCGSRSSSMYANGEQYITSNWALSEILFRSGRCDPYISERLRDLFDWSQYPKVEFEPIPVRDCPLDGFRLPGDPDWFRTCPDFQPNPRLDWSKRSAVTGP